MKHTFTMKLFLTTVLVTLLVSSCSNKVDPWEVTPNGTTTPIETLVALPAIDRYATETSTPLPTDTPTPNVDLISDLSIAKQYEGQPVRIVDYTIVDYTHLDMYLKSVRDGTEIILHTDEDAMSIKLADIGDDGFTHAQETWSYLPEDTVLLSIALDSFIEQGTVFTFQLPWFDEGEEYTTPYLYEEYNMTVRDEALYEYSALHTGPEGCSWQFYVPIDSVSCLIETYHEWGTKDGLDEFLTVTGLPKDAVGWFGRDGYVPYIDGVEEANVPAYIAEHNLPIEIRLFADWNYLGNTEYFLYKADSVPNMFLSRVEEFPEYTVQMDEDRFYIYPDTIFDGGHSYGTLITYSGEGYGDELFVPDGYVVVFVKDTVAGGCECWSPFLDFTILGVYR